MSILKTQSVSISQLPQYIDDYPNVITLLSESELKYHDKELQALKDKNHLVIKVNDIDYENFSSGVRFSETFVNPQAKAIIEFALEHKNEPILVHCSAGISRSQAVALYIAKHIYKDNDLFNTLYHSENKKEGGNHFIYSTLCREGLSYPEIEDIDQSPDLSF